MSYRVDSQISGTYDTLLRRKSYILGSSKRREGQFHTTSPLVTISLNCMTLQTSKTSPVKKQFRYEVPVGHNFGGCDEVSEDINIRFELDELKHLFDELLFLDRVLKEDFPFCKLMGRVGAAITIADPSWLD